MTIDFTPWDTPKTPWQNRWREKLKTHIEVSWRGRLRQVKVQLIEREGHYWIFLQETPSDGLWVVTPFEGRLDNCYPLNWDGIFNEANLADMARLAIAGHKYRLGCFFVFPEHGVGDHLAVVLWPTGQGTCLKPRIGLQSASFRFSPTHQLSGKETYDRLKVSLDDPDTDLCFAANWLFAWEDDRYWMLYPLYNQAREVMRWMLLCCPETGEIETLWRCILNPPFPDQSSISDFANSFGIGSSPQLGRWLTLLCEQLNASTPQELLDRHPCVAQYKSHKPAFVLNIKVAPTAHERMEAALKLRQWFDDNNFSTEFSSPIG